MPLGMEGGLGPGDFVLDGDPPTQKRGTAPNFWPMSIVAKGLHGPRCHMLYGQLNWKQVVNGRVTSLQQQGIRHPLCTDKK